MAVGGGKRALIFGISGQDGALLARVLLERGYEVHGTSRDHEVASFANLRRLGVFDRVTLHSASLGDYRSIIEIIDGVRPMEIYNLAAQSSVGLSFNQPVNTINSTMFGVINVLEALRFLKLDARLYNASSGECFGNTGPEGATEESAFHPRSPYAVGKAAAHWAVANYRDSFRLYACSGLLFNHESTLRPRRFVTRKIVAGAVDIAKRRSDRLTLGDLSIVRDWGWAEEYVVAMWLMLQQAAPADYVIATGEPHSLREFVEQAFRYIGLDWTKHVDYDAALSRPSDVAFSVGRPEKARAELGWTAGVRMAEVVKRLIEDELRLRATSINLPAG
jgi:GDPmannose 4,6-dehydratase